MKPESEKVKLGGENLNWATQTLYFLRKGKYAEARSYLEGLLSQVTDRVYFFSGDQPVDIRRRGWKHRITGEVVRAVNNTTDWIPLYWMPVGTLKQASSSAPENLFKPKRGLFKVLQHSSSLRPTLILQPEFTPLSTFTLSDGAIPILEQKEKWGDVWVLVESGPVLKGVRLVVDVSPVWNLPLLKLIRIRDLSPNMKVFSRPLNCYVTFTSSLKGASQLDRKGVRL